MVFVAYLEFTPHFQCLTRKTPLFYGGFFSFFYRLYQTRLKYEQPFALQTFFDEMSKKPMYFLHKSGAKGLYFVFTKCYNELDDFICK